MYRVIAAKSLKYGVKAKGKGNKSSQKKELQIHNEKREHRRRNRVVLDDTDVSLTVSNMISDKGQKMGKELKGVWSPVGVEYMAKGEPDTSLGQPLLAVHLNSHNRAKHSDQRQKVEKLVDLFETTKEKLRAIDLFSENQGNNKSMRQKLMASHTTKGGSLHSLERNVVIIGEDKNVSSTLMKVCLLSIFCYIFRVYVM